MKSLLIVDDFYKDPMAVRDFALRKVEYLKQEELEQGYVGTESLRSYYSKDVIEKLSRVVGQEIEVNPRTFSFGVFSKTYSSEESKKSVHVDSSEWTAVVYLNESRNEKGGTSFYRSRKWGFDELPSDDELANLGLGGRKQFVSGPLKEVGRLQHEWEETARVSMKFNRMVLFRAGEMFHAANGYFGSKDEDCRLTQLFFFNLKKIGR